MADITPERAEILANNLVIQTCDEYDPATGELKGEVFEVIIPKAETAALRSKSADDIRDFLGNDTGDRGPADAARPGLDPGQRLHAVMKIYATRPNPAYKEWQDRRKVTSRVNRN